MPTTLMEIVVSFHQTRPPKNELMNLMNPQLEDSGDESEGCGRIKRTRREGSNATLLCHERKVLLAESTEH